MSMDLSRFWIFSSWAFSHRSLASLSFLVMAALVACTDRSSWTTTDMQLRPTVENLGRGKNTFTLILENPASSRSVLILADKLQAADDAGNIYKPAPYAMGPDELSKLVLPQKKVRISYVLERAITTTATTLAFTLNDLAAREQNGPDWFPLPALGWRVDLLSAPNAPSSTGDGADSPLLVTVENLCRGCRQFTLILENKATDRVFTLYAPEILTLVDDTGTSYHIDSHNTPTTEWERVLHQRKLRIDYLLEDPIRANAKAVTFYVNSIQTTLDSGTTYTLFPLHWDAIPRDATPLEIEQEKELPLSLKEKQKQLDKEIKEAKAENRRQREYIKEKNREVQKKLEAYEKRWADSRKQSEAMRRELERRGVPNAAAQR